LQNGITIAGRYSCIRKQFGVENEEEQAIINYPTTQMRILPALAEHVAIRAACFDLGSRWLKVLVSYNSLNIFKPIITEVKNPEVIETHAILSALKPYSSSLTQFRLQQLRESMGGHGYSRLSMIGAYRNNNDIHTTWEGDNTVLVQQTARFILDNFNSKMKGKNVSYKVIYLFI
jgi:acyl-CoA oxidase